MKSLVLLILLLSILYINCDDCGTPVECYVKAINILNSDRAEMRIMNSHNQELINQLKIEIQGLNTKIVDLQNRLTNTDSTVRNKRCYVATGSSKWGQCPYGGSYLGGWNLESKQTAGIEAQNVWTNENGIGFLCCN